MKNLKKKCRKRYRCKYCSFICSICNKKITKGDKIFCKVFQNGYEYEKYKNRTNFHYTWIFDICEESFKSLQENYQVEKYHVIDVNETNICNEFSLVLKPQQSITYTHKYNNKKNTFEYKKIY